MFEYFRNRKVRKARNAEAERARIQDQTDTYLLGIGMNPYGYDGFGAPLSVEPERVDQDGNLKDSPYPDPHDFDKYDDSPTAVEQDQQLADSDMSTSQDSTSSYDSGYDYSSSSSSDYSSGSDYSSSDSGSYDSGSSGGVTSSG